MTIPTLSPLLSQSLTTTLEKLAQDEGPIIDPQEATLIAMQQILVRIELGEKNLYEPLHKGDTFALSLAQMK